jgi:hydrogenase maturation protein HypF
MPALEQLTARRIRVRGRVQGVGFRPSVHRLATSLKLHGWVCNDADGVLIHVEGRDADLECFAHRLQARVPSAAQIETVVQEMATCDYYGDFQIRVSPSLRSTCLTAHVPADRAICVDCSADVLESHNRRCAHAFASCIQCGPRYSILQEMPYEREGTSMRCFPICRACRAEFENPDDRRFHAEPIACSACGPRLRLEDDAQAIAGDWHSVLATTQALRLGRIIALKGLGGYQLMVRADDDRAVTRLRERKHRPSKPFAVMVRSIEEAERIAHISVAERELLLSPANPIVLLQSRTAIAPAVAPGLTRIGILLPTTPLHLLLLSQIDFPVVATSGNQSEEPIAIDNKGREALKTIADVFLDHDRDIVRRVDDSVVRLIDDRPIRFRLARGFAPCVLPALERWAASCAREIPPILALGGQQKTALALWTGAQAILSQHLGDMDHPEARRGFSQAVTDLAGLYRSEPKIHAADFHPDYHTTRYGQAARIPFLQAQHHHAHAVACMVEHDLLDRNVLGVIFDGTGFGLDGTIWGGEILHASIHEFQRLASLDLFALPGGETAIHEPNRIALSLLAATVGSTEIPPWLLDRLGFTKSRAHMLLRMIARQVNSPLTSSVGRLFDGVAALLLDVHRVSYEGEAALFLEDAVDPTVESAYSIPIRLDQTGMRRGSWRPMIQQVVNDIANSVPAGTCAARFHNALASWSATIAASSGISDVVLGGGCFQNGYLLNRTRTSLENLGKRVHAPSRIPPNDGGLSVGQLAVAMARCNKQQ